MKKVILGAVMGFGLSFGGYAIAQNQSMYVVDRSNGVTKVYDPGPNVVCYVYNDNHNVGGISCLKNI